VTLIGVNMGRPPDSTKTKTFKWQKNNSLLLLLLESDSAEYYKVDDRGYIQTNKRAYAGLQATVILGKHDVMKEDYCQLKDIRVIHVSKSDDMFTCEIGGRGALSSIGKEYAGDGATVIIHTH
jgi:hypothetical protein